MAASKSTQTIYVSSYSLSINANVGAQLHPVSTEIHPAPEAHIRQRRLPRTSQPISTFTALTQSQEKQLLQHLQAQLSKAQSIEIHATQPAAQPALLSLLWASLSQAASPPASALPAPETPPESGLQSAMLRAAAPRSRPPSLPALAYINASNSPLSDLQQEIFSAFYQKPQALKLDSKQLAHYLGQVEAWLVVEDLCLSPLELQRLLKLIPNCKLIYTSHRPLQPQATSGYLFELANNLGYSQYLRQLRHSIRTLSKFDLRLLTALAPLEGIAIQQKTILELFKNLFKEPAKPSQLRAAIARLTQLNLLCETGDRNNQYLQIHPAVVSHLSLNSARTNATLTYVFTWIKAASSDSNQLCRELRLVYWAIAQTRENGDWKTLLSLLRAAEPAFIYRQWWGRWAQMLFWKLEAAQHLEDRPAIAWVHHQLGSRALCLGEWSAAQAHLDRALILRQSYGDAVGAAATSRHLDILIAPTTQASEFVRSSSATSPSTTSTTTQTKPTRNGSARRGSASDSSTSNGSINTGPASSNATSSHTNPIAVPIATIAPSLIKSAATVALLTGGGGLLWAGAQQVQTGLDSPKVESVASASQASAAAQQDNSNRSSAQDISQNSFQILESTAQSASESDAEQPSQTTSMELAEADIEVAESAEASTEQQPKRAISRTKAPLQPTEPPVPALPAPPRAGQPPAQPVATTASTPPVAPPQPEPTHCLVGRWTSDLSDPMRGDAFVGDRAILTTILEKFSDLGGQDLSHDTGHIGQILTNSDYRDRVLGRQDLIEGLEAQQPGQPRLDISIRHANTQGSIDLSISEDGSLVSTYNNLSHGFDISYGFEPETSPQTHQVRWQLNGQMTAQADFSEQHNQIAYSNAQWNIQPSLNEGRMVPSLPAINTALSEVSQSLRPLESLQPSTYSCSDNELALNMTLKVKQQMLSFVRRYRRVE